MKPFRSSIHRGLGFFNSFFLAASELKFFVHISSDNKTNVISAIATMSYQSVGWLMKGVQKI